jgi:uncharacterized membrane protein YoaK (UPF0700 family)
MAAADPHRMRDLLLVILAIASGATDAAAFERLGHAFASVITGNLVILGVSAIARGGSQALFSGTALAGYIVGVFLAAPRRDHGDLVWPLGATVALVLDLGLLVLFAVGWEVVGGDPGRTMQVLLLAVVAGAMGVQSSAVRRMGQVSTTYLTSTLTGLVESVAVRRWSQSNTRGLAIIAAALAGAAGATALVLYAHAWLPALQLLPLLVVLAASRRLIGRPAAGAGSG